MENSKEGLTRAIEIIKARAMITGNLVTVEEIAQKLSLSRDELIEYLEGSVKIADGVVPKLLSSYGIKSRQFEFRVDLDIDDPNDDEEDAQE